MSFNAAAQLYAGIDQLKGDLVKARRTGSTDSAATMPPDLSPAVVSLIDFSLVHDAEQRPTAHELYSFVVAMNDSAAQGGADESTREFVEVQDDEIARLRAQLAENVAEIAAKDAQLAEKDEQIAELTRRNESKRPRSARRLDEGLDEARTTPPPTPPSAVGTPSVRPRGRSVRWPRLYACSRAAAGRYPCIIQQLAVSYLPSRRIYLAR